MHRGVVQKISTLLQNEIERQTDAKFSEACLVKFEFGIEIIHVKHRDAGRDAIGYAPQTATNYCEIDAIKIVATKIKRLNVSAMWGEPLTDSRRGEYVQSGTLKLLNRTA